MAQPMRTGTRTQTQVLESQRQVLGAASLTTLMAFGGLSVVQLTLLASFAMSVSVKHASVRASPVLCLTALHCNG